MNKSSVNKDRMQKERYYKEQLDMYHNTPKDFAYKLLYRFCNIVESHLKIQNDTTKDLLTEAYISSRVLLDIIKHVEGELKIVTDKTIGEFLEE